MCFMDTCFYERVLFIVRTHASNACVSWTLAFMCKVFIFFIFFTIYMDDNSFLLDTFWKMKIGFEEDNGACLLLFRQRIKWK